MIQKKRGLGFNPLLGLDKTTIDAVLQDREAMSEQRESNSDNLVQVPLDVIVPNPFQPRKFFPEEEIDELAQSINQHGIMQPIIVRKATNGYELIAGERRWRAAQILQLDSIPAIVRNIDNQQVAALALIENIQREELTAIEQARALGRMRDEFDMDQTSLAEMISSSRSNVANLLRLLNLNSNVQSMLETGTIEMGHARALIPLPDSEQNKIAQDIVLNQLSVRQAEMLVKRSLATKIEKTSNHKSADRDVLRLETNLSEQLGTSVKIKIKSKNKGQILIDFSCLDVLDGIIARLNSKV